MSERQQELDLRTPYFPSYAEDGAQANLLSPDISAILGGSTPALLADEAWPRCTECEEPLVPYIQINLASPRTPAEFRAKFPGANELDAEGRAPIFQVLICATDENAECFSTNVVSSPGGGQAVVRVVWIASVDGAAVAAARAELGEEQFFAPERVISSWTSGREEIEHPDSNGDVIDLPEEIHERFAAAQGLKLLGWPIRGKFSSAQEVCPLGDGEVHYRNRSIIQLGMWADYDEEKEETPTATPIYLVGNTYIDQCDQHPLESFTMAISGDW